MANALRRLLQTIHLWMGIVLCIPIVLISLTGSALLLQREILSLIAPSPNSEGPTQSVERIVGAARAAVPEQARANWVDLPTEAGKAAVVQFSIGQRPSRRVDVSIDPISLQILGSENYVRRGPIKTVLVDIHEFMMMPEHIGFPFVGWMGVAMTFMGISGIIVWWPRRGQWRGTFAVRSGIGALRLNVDLHRLVGIAGSLIFLILSVSGVYLIFPVEVSGLVNALLPGQGREYAPPDGDFTPAGPLNHDDAIKVALAVVADAPVTGIQLPPAPGRPYIVQMEPPGFGPTVPAIMVTIDAKTAAIDYIDDPRDHSPAERAINLMHAAHFSVGLGPVWNLIVFLSGILPLFLAVTGITIWWKRRRAGVEAAALASQTRS